MRRLVAGTWVMAIVAWLTVITGTWHRLSLVPRQATPRASPAAEAALKEFPRYFLLANEQTAEWHTFGMEWKEHVAWLAPLLATAVAFFVSLATAPSSSDHGEMRRAVMVILTLAFAAAGIAGLFGALITKAAPVH